MPYSKPQQSKPINSNLIIDGRLPDRSWSRINGLKNTEYNPIHKPSDFSGPFDFVQRAGKVAGESVNKFDNSRLNPYEAFGPGHCNKYCAINNSPTLVRFQRDFSKFNESRDLWKNPSNPYQFDQTWLRRTENASKEISEKQERDKISHVLQTRSHSLGSLSTRSGNTNSSSMISARSDISTSSYGGVPSRPYSIRKSQSFEYTNDTPFTNHQKSPYIKWVQNARDNAIIEMNEQAQLPLHLQKNSASILTPVLKIAMRDPNPMDPVNPLDPLANLPLRKSNYQNTVTTLARDKPGYQGFIAAEAAENVHSKLWAQHVRRCGESRPYLMKSGSFYGPLWDGTNGYVERPKKYEGERGYKMKV